MKDYWLHRITGGDNASPFSYPLLFKHNLLSIGWCDFSTNEYLESFKQQGIAAIDRAIDEEWEQGFRPKNRYNLYRFVCEMKKGDVVLVPYWGEFSIFEIVDDEILSNESVDTSLFLDGNGQTVSLNDVHYLMNTDGNNVDLGFYRKVRPLSLHIPRSDYADNALTARMKLRQTNANINDLSVSVDDAINKFENKKPINIKAEVMYDATRLLLDKIRSLGTPQKFEELVQWYLEAIGGTVETPSKYGEGDADRVAYFDHLKVAVMVQVKHHANMTGNWAVEQILAFNKSHDYDDYTTLMWVISTCDDYDESAKEFAKLSNVRLIDGFEFCEMIIDAGLEDFPL